MHRNAPYLLTLICSRLGPLPVAGIPSAADKVGYSRNYRFTYTTNLLIAYCTAIFFVVCFDQPCSYPEYKFSGQIRPYEYLVARLNIHINLNQLST